MLGQEAGRALSDEADPEGVEDARQPAAPRAGDRVDEVGRRLLGEPLELGQLGDGEPVEVGEVAHQPSLDELLDDGLAEVLDVHGAPRAEVEQRLLELGGAGGVRAAKDDLALRSRRARVAHRAPVREGQGTASAGRRSSSTLTMCGITSPARSTTTVSPLRTSSRWTSLKLCSVVLLMVTPPIRTGASTRRGSQRAGPADVDLEVEHARLGAPGRELVGDRPAGMVGCRAQPPLVAEAVHLHDGAVRVVAEAIPLGLEPLAIAPDLVQGRARLAARVRREPALPERREHLRVGLERERLGMTQLVDEDPEVPPRGHAGVLLAYRPGRGVPRIGERCLALGLQLAIEPIEGPVAHVDLAPDLHAPAARERADQTERDRADGPEIGGHVLPEPPVAARRASLEHRRARTGGPRPRPSTLGSQT